MYGPLRDALRRKLTYSISFILILCLLLTSATNAADPTLAGGWNLNEGSGSVAEDSSNNDNDGSLQGGPNWVAGQIGNALEFDGADDYVDCGNDESLNITGEITIAAWIHPTGGGSSDYPRVVDKSSGTGGADAGYKMYLRVADGYVMTLSAGGVYPMSSGSVELNTWSYVAFITDGTQRKFYLNGEWEVWEETSLPVETSNSLYIGNSPAGARHFQGMIDEVRVYNRALSEDEVDEIMSGIGAVWPYASNPIPADGALYEDTWVTLNWTAGDSAVSHDVYIGENFNEVGEATPDSDVYQGNQTEDFIVAGFPGFVYPDGLVPGTTYYWRIDEVNDADPNSPWKGDVWSFSIPTNKAHDPSPADGADSIDLDVTLSWTMGFGAKMHTLYFGEDYDTVANATVGVPVGTTTYDPGTLKAAKSYYWRVDEFDGLSTYKGEVWSFTTEGGISNPYPADGAVEITQTPVLTWDPGVPAASHQVYFGTDENAVRSATTASAEYKGTKALGDEAYEPGQLAWETTYYWRIDEVNNVNADSPWKGPVWSFTTAAFAIVEDFEGYTDDDTAGEAIWQSWIDGYGVADNGSQVGYLLPPYAEQTTVHGGSQSMPLMYNNVGGVTNSEATLSLTARDWTQEGVTELSLWVHGLPASLGSFVEDPVGTYTITGAGADIWNAADEFHYAYKTLTGAGSIQAQVLSVENTNTWAKAGVMIRETLDAGSKFAAVYMTPGNGCRFQARMDTDGDATSDTDVATDEQIALTAPYWVKLERTSSGIFRGHYSSDGVNWRSMSWNSQSISMSSSVYIGLALTSHSAGVACEAKISNVQTTGTVNGQWANQDIGITSNAAEPLYVAIANSSGSPAVVTHEDPAAATIDDWVEWIIPLQSFSDQGINLRNVDSIAIGLGTTGDPTAAGGVGTIYIDDIRLY